ncbi:hypothetical protein [Streptomyces sp. NBC_00316]|uniref:hypothetical protein n=1 Tax=Streptomyces sp. NBC_00316 TaxID=2975710 RepID=UPI002E2B4DAA|nr:hypothetical protein [Streptomyces sp. NBC_00316]
MLIELTARRLYCENVRCSRRTFAEQVDGLTVRYGRRTPSGTPSACATENVRQFAAVLAPCTELTALHGHVRAFAEILTTRSGRHLKDWLTATRTEDLPGLHTFTHGQEKDWDAVAQGPTTCWNSGPMEVRGNDIKMIKYQLFGRAKLPLLRKRVLLTAAQGSPRRPT